MIYTIKQGRHYSNILNPNRLWVGYGVHHIDFSFQFLNNPCYVLGNEDDWDINKLFGISFGPEHHKNSFRIGWRPTNDNMISLHSYYYNHGTRKDSFIYAINYNSVVDGGITIDREAGKITTWISVNGNSVWSKIDFNFDDVSLWSFRLFPYFGGNARATHDIHLSLKNKIECKFVI